VAHFYLLHELTQIVAGTTVVLDGSEGRHAATVSRIRVGESIQVGDGRGTTGEGVVVAATKDTLTIAIDSVRHHDAESPELILIQALAKTDRDERAVEMATELGISRVIPWLADRSISRWDETKAEKGRQKWQSIAREASKQSIRAQIPVVEAVATADELLTRFDSSQLLILDPAGTCSLSDVSLDADVIALVVGPEGGISDSELAQFRNAGAHIVTLGKNILRTSTAGPAALAVINGRLGRL
jgi:16S rRNA (uracil1498-N3)-methyltransferase